MIPANDFAVEIQLSTEQSPVYGFSQSSVGTGKSPLFLAHSLWYTDLPLGWWTFISSPGLLISLASDYGCSYVGRENMIHKTYKPCLLKAGSPPQSEHIIRAKCLLSIARKRHCAPKRDPGPMACNSPLSVAAKRDVAGGDHRECQLGLGCTAVCPEIPRM